MDTIISGEKTAYCPNHGCERTIYLNLRKHLMSGATGFEVRQFDCANQNDCDYARQVEFCPFLQEITNYYISRY